MEAFREGRCDLFSLFVCWWMVWLGWQAKFSMCTAVCVLFLFPCRSPSQ